MNPQFYPQLPTYSQSKQSSPQPSILSQALSHMTCTFPQKPSALQAHIKSIPHYLMNQNVYKQIVAYNRKQTVSLFQYICELAVNNYKQYKTAAQMQNMNNSNAQQILNSINQLCAKLIQFIPQGNSYANNLYNDVKAWKIVTINQNNQITFVKAMLYSLAATHHQIYEIQNRSSISMQQMSKGEALKEYLDITKISYKYRQLIDDKIDAFLVPKTNYFQKLIITAMQNQHKRKSSQQIQAQQNASILNLLIKNEYNNSTNKNNSNNNANYNNTNYNNNNIANMQQNINNLIGYNAYKQQNGIKNAEFANWFTNSMSQMTYYQSYMMAHMAELMFINADKFNIRFIPFHPYLEKLYNKINEQLNQLKSSDMAFRIIFNSKLKQVQFNNYNNNNNNNNNNAMNLPMQSIKQPNKQQFNIESKEKSKQKSKKEKGIFDKALKMAKNCYEKAKQEYVNLNKNKQQVRQVQNPLQMRPIQGYQGTKYVQQHQNIIISNNLIIPDIFYRRAIMDLQSFSFYLRNVNQKYYKEMQEHKNLLEKAVYFVGHLNKQNRSEQLKYYHEVQSWMAIVMLVYKALAMNYENNYDYTPFKRKQIIRICKSIFSQQQMANASSSENQKAKIAQSSFRNWPVVLKFLQNNRVEVANSAISSSIEKQAQTIIESYYRILKNRQVNCSSINNLFDGIDHLQQNIPSIKLVCLSSGSQANQNLNKAKTTTQCKVVHILISGFLSQDTDKLQEWADMTDQMHDSEIYALVWESTTIKGLLKFFLKSVSDVFGAAKMLDQIRKKYTDNPFNPAFQVAQITGRILAQIIIRLFPKRFVNICGYSLGSQVIKQFLRRMIQQNQTNLINNIYIMGGVSDNRLIAQLISQSQSPLSVYNCYTNNDAVLKHLLSLCKPDIKPVGLKQIPAVEGHNVINMDCTKFISGHLAFRSNLGIMAKVLEASIG